MTDEAGVVVWALTQPAEDTYDFTALDDVLDRAAAEGRGVCLTTGTAALPPWLAERYPEVNRRDVHGRRHRSGRRYTFCPNSPQYRRLSTAMAARLAERYGHHPALLAWHVDNEYGGACHCDLCAQAFREWLRTRHGTLDAPTEHVRGITPAYRRFMTDALLGCFAAEKAAIREYDPETPVTMNLSRGLKDGTPFRPLEQTLRQQPTLSG